MQMHPNDSDMPLIAPPNPDGRTRILLPGGIGDIYWVLVKLKSFLRRQGIEEKPLVSVLGPNIWESSRRRSIPFLQSVPFVEVANPPVEPMMPTPSKYLEWVYSHVSVELIERVWPGFMGFEYFLCFNGIINTGHYLEEVDPELECDWYFPMRISDEQSEYQDDLAKRYGRYAIFFFSFMGDFVTQNLAHFPLEKLAEGINRICSEKGLVPIFIGAWWDLKWPKPHGNHVDRLPLLIDMVPGAVNLVGQTTLDQAFGAMRGAEMVSGYHCGLTNMAIAFRRPTVLLWSERRFPPKTPLAVAPPDSRNTFYIPLYTDHLTVDEYVHAMGRAIDG